VKINILYEDEYLKVVEKPAGVLSYPLPGNDEETIGDMVGALPVHRLDRDTSGILILAKSEEAKAQMQKLFKERKVEKRYKALVWGKVEPEAGEINIPLGRGSKDRLRVVPAHGGRESVTEYRVEKYFSQANSTLVDVNLKTGRTHQIRVHFHEIGHPVVGDKKYFNRKSELSRQFLHAYSIKFEHPYLKKKLAFSSDLPKDLKTYLNQIS
jgi:23S rRNA pseudouridine1911/1915/1917 synthase